ncbi:MAG: cell division protein [Nevskia sp.]|nr:cell division protein [Nevskia sp.]
MGIAFHYPTGSTPLDPDEVAGLIPGHVATQGQLNEWELANIIEGQKWAFNPRRKSHPDLLSADFMKALHKRMFDQTWKWAGTFRKTEKNIGVAPEYIAIRLKDLCDDIKAQLEYKTWPPDEIAARFHHRLVFIHPFPNGNGRHSRLMTDLLLARLAQPRFTWGADDLVAESTARRRYIDALRKADAKDYSALFTFVRS